MKGTDVKYDDRIAYTEEELYALSRSLKFQAREKRKVRLEEERAKAKEREDSIKHAEWKADRDKQAREKKLKDEYDARVRRMLLDMAETVKSHGFAFEGPVAPLAWSGTQTKGAQTITFIDTKRIPGQDMAHYTFGKKTVVKTTHNGFHWD
jgi:hypothetical protein